MNTVEEVFLYCGRASFGLMPMSHIVGSLDRTITNFLRNHQTNFKSGCINLYPHQHRGVYALQLPQHVLSLWVLILGILTGARWNLRVVLIWIFLKIRDFEPFFKCFLAIRDLLVDKFSVKFCTPFLIGLFGLFMSNFLYTKYDLTWIILAY